MSQAEEMWQKKLEVALNKFKKRRKHSVIYVKDYIKPKLCTSFKAHDSLVVSLECDLGVIHIACVYRSQALTSAEDKQLVSALKNLSVDHPDDEVIIVGDFNLPDVCWVTGTVRGSSETRNRMLLLQQDYVDLITDLGFTWHITDEITRRRVVSGVLQESTLRPPKRIRILSALVFGPGLYTPHTTHHTNRHYTSPKYTSRDICLVEN